MRLIGTLARQHLRDNILSQADIFVSTSPCNTVEGVQLKLIYSARIQKKN